MGHTWVAAMGPARTNAVSVCPPRCKFFSLTETPEDYTIIVDEEGFLGEYFSHLEPGCIVLCAQPWLPPPRFCLHLLVG